MKREDDPVQRLHNLCDGLAACDICEKPADDDDSPVTLCGACFAQLKAERRTRVFEIMLGVAFAALAAFALLLAAASALTTD